jgi:hypothetical protein
LAIQALKLTIGLHDAFYRQVPKGSNCAVQVCWAVVLRDQRQHMVWFFICDRRKSWFGEAEVRGTNFWELVEYYAQSFDRICAG